MARDDPMMRFRAPPELKQKIEEAAVSNGRSLNAEIVQRLEGEETNSRTEALEAFLKEELDELQHAMPHLIAARNEQKEQLQAAMDVLLSGTPIEDVRMAELRYELRLAQERLEDKAALLRRIERVLAKIKCGSL
ncbi:Arc family DNA-binding protein [Gluconobacter albidus]|uniref:Arc family DNA-binding protein n=1 Tax=Gluconobacter albidus TaxID=318683 RepID=UPI0007838596|nr:Arc family DNA-binding protein [Gluconobacter albidus]